MFHAGGNKGDGAKNKTRGFLAVLLPDAEPVLTRRRDGDRGESNSRENKVEDKIDFQTAELGIACTCLYRGNT
jgi:hypothetical protein